MPRSSPAPCADAVYGVDGLVLGLLEGRDRPLEVLRRRLPRSVGTLGQRPGVGHLPPQVAQVALHPIDQLLDVAPPACGLFVHSPPSLLAEEPLAASPPALGVEPGGDRRTLCNKLCYKRPKLVPDQAVTKPNARRPPARRIETATLPDNTAKKPAQSTHPFPKPTYNTHLPQDPLQEAWLRHHSTGRTFPTLDPHFK